MFNLDALVYTPNVSITIWLVQVTQSFLFFFFSCRPVMHSLCAKRCGLSKLSSGICGALCRNLRRREFKAICAGVPCEPLKYRLGYQASFLARHSPKKKKKKKKKGQGEKRGKFSCSQLNKLDLTNSTHRSAVRKLEGSFNRWRNGKNDTSLNKSRSAGHILETLPGKKGGARWNYITLQVYLRFPAPGLRPQNDSSIFYDFYA